MPSPEITPQLISDCQRTIEECVDKASRYFNTRFPLPELSFKLRGRAAGKAYLQSWQIRLNPVLLSENREAFFSEVIPHEVAHLIVYQLFGRVRPHGKEWQGVMQQVLGVKPNTTHSLDVSSVQGKQFAYRCGCQQHLLSVRRHNKIVRGQVRYHCRDCQQQLCADPA